jgi:hypothetical protein
MTDAEIQAIVGFIRQWEPTAPEVATITRPGGGGPPWMRNNNTTATGLLPSTSSTTPKGGGTGQNTMGQDATQSLFDWRFLTLVGVILSIAFTLIFTAMDSLRHVPQKTE